MTINTFSRYLVATLLCVSSFASADNVFGKSFFTHRSQGSNWPRWMVGQAYHLYLPDTDCMNGSFSITPEWTQSFNGQDIGEYLFFNGTNSMIFGPSKLNGDGTVNPAGANTDVFARNFFLNDDFESVVTTNPKVSNFIADLNLYLGLDEWIPGLYFRVDVPVAWTRWDMNLHEEVKNPGTTIAADKMGNAAAEPAPINSVIEAWKGNITDPNFPHVKQGLSFAKVDGPRTNIGIADVTLLLGYNFFLEDCYHLGLNIGFIVPTGTRPNGQFFFEPVVGNGRHFEAGLGFTGHYDFWYNGCDSAMGIYAEGNFFHMFRATQKRTFDLKNNGIGSRYLLFKKFTGTGTPTYADEIVFGPNITTLDCRVSNDFHADIAAMFDYKKCGLTIDFGYNFWMRSKDNITITGEIPVNTFGVQGDTDTDIVGNAPNNTQSLTTINGTFAPIPDDGPTPVTITVDSLDPESAASPSAITNKLFFHIGYTWENCDYLPFFGIGGEVEISSKKGHALNQFGVWAKGGFTFA